MLLFWLFVDVADARGGVYSAAMMMLVYFRFLQSYFAILAQTEFVIVDADVMILRDLLG